MLLKNLLDGFQIDLIWKACNVFRLLPRFLCNETSSNDQVEVLEQLDKS